MSTAVLLSYNDQYATLIMNYLALKPMRMCGRMNTSYILLYCTTCSD